MVESLEMFVDNRTGRCRLSAAKTVNSSRVLLKYLLACTVCYLGIAVDGGNGVLRSGWGSVRTFL